MPESDPSAPADSGVTQQSPTPRGAEAVYNIGAADPTDVIATLSADKTTLTITGTGAMMGWSTGDDMPWYPAVTTITTVKIGDGVTNIGDIAFYNCTALTSVTIGTGVKSIGANAFKNCGALSSVTLPDSVTDIGNYAFGYCSLLSSVTLPANVTNISKFAFQCCNALTSVDIPASVVTIGQFAFSYCEKLANVTMNFSDDIDKREKKIADSAFAASPITTTRVVAENTTPKFKKWSSKSTAGTVAEFTDVNAASTTLKNVPSNCTITAEYEAETETVYNIGAVNPTDVIAKLSADKTTLTITGTGAMKDWGSENEVPWNADRATITTVTIGDGVTNIGNFAFRNCTALTCATIGTGVTNIGAYGFGGCALLSAVTIPANVTTIGEYAFQFCDGLTVITLPASVTDIGKKAFF
ncbi:MAG: leucine-rich repeat domain-containing protein, partial [Ruthenibacterium sp.]